MMMTARAAAQIKSAQARDRDRLEDNYRNKEEAIRRDAAARRDAQHGENRAALGRGAHMAPHANVEEAHDRHVAEKVAALHDERRAARKALDEKHKSQMDAVMARPPAPSPAGQPPREGDPVFGLWGRLSGRQTHQYWDVKAKYDKLRDEIDGQQAGSRERTSRYDHPSVVSHADGRDVDQHMRINEKEHAELRQLAAGFQSDLAREQDQRNRHAAERASMARRQASESAMHR